MQTAQNALCRFGEVVLHKREIIADGSLLEIETWLTIWNVKLH